MKQLSEHHLNLIKEILDINCTETRCIKRADVLSKLQRLDRISVELYRFNQLLTEAIISGKIPGYTTKSGRNGGIKKATDPNMSQQDLLRKAIKDDVTKLLADTPDPIEQLTDYVVSRTQG